MVLGSSIASIGENAFTCSALESLTLPNSLSVIGFTAFAGCENLKRINLPASVIQISANEIDNCYALERIDAYPDPTKVDLGSSVFSDVPKDGTLHVLPQYVEAYSSADQWKEFTGIVGDLTDVVKGDLNDDKSVDGNDVSILLEKALSGG